MSGGAQGNRMHIPGIVTVGVSARLFSQVQDANLQGEELDKRE